MLELIFKNKQTLSSDFFHHGEKVSFVLTTAILWAEESKLKSHIFIPAAAGSEVGHPSVGKAVHICLVKVGALGW